MIRFWWRTSSVTRPTALARRGAKARARRGFSPHLEALEERALLAAGTVDTSFAGGQARTEFLGPIPSTGRAVAAQPDGKVLAAGVASNRFAVVRYLGNGSLDPSFGTGGQVLTLFRQEPHGSEEPSDLVVQPDGKIIAAGRWSDPTSGFRPTQALVSRYLANGQLDAGFATGGKLIFSATDLSSVAGVVVQPDGKLVVAGLLTVPNPPAVSTSTSVLWRFLPDGRPDATFGTGGRVSDPTALSGDIVLQPDGKIVAAGGSGAAGDFVLARYQTNGSIDASFGMGGYVVTRVGEPSPIFRNSASANSVVVQPDGKILAGGVFAGFRSGASLDVYVLTRHNPNGTLDTSFGSGGISRGTWQDRLRSINALTLLPDGRILAQGDAPTNLLEGPQGGTLTRFTPGGAVDTSFGTEGHVSLTSAADMMRQDDGRILIVGSLQRPGPPGPLMADLVVRRFTSEGAADASFGTDGQVISVLTGPAGSVVGGLVVQPDGKVVLAGAVGVPLQELGIGLVRHNPDGSLDASFGSGGRVLTPMDPRVTQVVAALLQAGGKIVVVGLAFGTASSSRIAMARYNPDGSLDTTFGTEGRVFAQLPGGESVIFIQAALQPDGRIVVAGTARSPSSNTSQLSAARFNADGSSDPSFVAEIPAFPPSQEMTREVRGLLVLPDGKILLSLTRPDQPVPTSGLVRLDSSGRPDPTFGSGGLLLTTTAGRLARAPNGQIIVGSRLENNVTRLGFQITRFNPDGSLDPVFGNPAMNRPPSDIYPGFTFDVNALAVEADGNVLFAGPAGGASGTEAALGRLDVNGFVDPLFGFGNARIHVGPSSGLVHLALLPDGRIILASSPNVNGVSVFAAAHVLTDDPIANRNERFITQLYADLLRRPPDATGLSAYVAALDEGRLTRTQVALAITASPEYRGVAVRELYRSLLRREADPGGLDAYVGFLGRGGMVAQVKANLLGSAEYFANRGQNTSLGFVTALYADVLGREPDAAGRDAFLQALAAGVSRTTVATVVLGSQEALEGLTRGWYARFLRRGIDLVGLQAFVAALQGGIREEVAISVLAGSDEYFGRL